MAKIYYRRILAGEITLDDVPLKWREAVRKLLEENYAARIKAGEITLADVPLDMRKAVQQILDGNT